MARKSPLQIVAEREARASIRRRECEKATGHNWLANWDGSVLGETRYVSATCTMCPARKVWPYTLEWDDCDRTLPIIKPEA